MIDAQEACFNLKLVSLQDYRARAEARLSIGILHDTVASLTTIITPKAQCNNLGRAMLCFGIGYIWPNRDTQKGEYPRYLAETGSGS